MKKTKEKGRKSPKFLTQRQETFAEMIVAGLPPQRAYLAAGYSPKAVTKSPYSLLKKEEIREHIERLFDMALPGVVKNALIHHQKNKKTSLCP